jgi:transcription antitermination factor NusA-like protein
VLLEPFCQRLGELALVRDADVHTIIGKSEHNEASISTLTGLPLIVLSDLSLQVVCADYEISRVSRAKRKAARRQIQ